VSLVREAATVEPKNKKPVDRYHSEGRAFLK
jgi:hypothetical protein